jgi:hypothetical protein
MAVAMPLKVDAFVFNAAVCNGEGHKARISPITQPNYTFLRMEEYMALSDLLPHTDLYNASPSTRNSRYTDLGTGEPRTSRQGVYLHWILPRAYRSGEASDPGGSVPPVHPGAGKDRFRLEEDNSAPSFPPVPNRWLVIRKIERGNATVLPQEASIPEVAAWVIESDRMRRIDELAADLDLQVDVAPFINAVASEDPGSIPMKEQAEVFIGRCTPVGKWDKDDVGNTVELTVASSSNQLFPDSQYHCGNVFSMLDTFAYEENDVTKHLTSVRAHYYVVGWHTDESKDILAKKPTGPGPWTRGTALEAHRLSLPPLPEPLPDTIRKWLDNQTSTRSVCHGAIYDVDWNVERPPPTIPANECGKKLGDRMAVAVGTTPMETLLTFAGVHQDPGTLPNDIHGLRKYLRSEDETLDSQEAAADELQGDNFMHLDGGTYHTFADQKEAQPAQRPPEEVEKCLKTLNAAQRLQDAVSRRLQQLQWEMFATWWKYISDVDNEDHSRDPIYETAVGNIKKSLVRLNGARGVLNDRIKDTVEDIHKLGSIEPKAAAMPEFGQHRDPTLLIAGVQAGWPRDFQQKLQVRLESQFVTEEHAPAVDAATVGLIKEIVPEGLIPTLTALVQEFLILQHQPVPKTPDAGQILPLYHDATYPGQDIDPTANPCRDRWAGRQPWFPLYVEWEGEYTDISFKHWQLSQKESNAEPLTQYTQYVVTSDVSKESPDGHHKVFDDTRLLSGRNLILPQPSFTLRAHVRRLLDTIPADDLRRDLPDDRREVIETNIDRFAFLSAPLAGFTEHLLTLGTGNHVKPLVRQPGKKPIPLKDALAAANHIRLDSTDLAWIDAASDPTPYGANMSLVGHGTYSAFKPVTHGQFRFTRLNVIDKFGQAISAIKPSPQLDRPPPLFPCVGDYYAPQTLAGQQQPNVIDPGRAVERGDCEFIQLPPSINQPVRLNVAFLAPEHAGVPPADDVPDKSYWRPVTDWESPIWGWVMVNYANRSLQLFLPDGTFYREVRVTQGSVKTAVAWLPFRPEGAAKPDNVQLEELLRLLTDEDQTYLLEFIDMIDAALRDTSAPPATYGAFQNALTGRPLALVSTGWSLEVSQKPRQNQSTLADQQGLPGPNLLQDYAFPMRLGNASRRTDGLVCYFLRRERHSGRSGDDFDLTKIYTYSSSQKEESGKKGESGDKGTVNADKLKFLHPIQSATLPTLKPYWDDPEKYVSDAGGAAGSQADHTRYEASRNKHWEPIAALIDPFLPVHAYTGILPTQALRLPNWTWESSLKRIVTFFHVGPLLVTENVPNFHAGHELTQEKWEEARGKPSAKPEAGYQVQLPALAVADWAWLQPYAVEEKKGALQDAAGEVETVKKFMLLGIGQSAVAAAGSGPPAGMNGGVCTAIEGYLQMTRPMEDEGK